MLRHPGFDAGKKKCGLGNKARGRMEPLDRVQETFTRRYRHTPAVRAFLAGDNLRATHRRLSDELRAVYAARGLPAPQLVLDATLVDEAEAFALAQIDAPVLDLPELNRAFVAQYTEPLAAQLYVEQEFRTRLDDAKESGRSALHLRRYSQQVMDWPELGPTPAQSPSLTSLPRQMQALPTDTAEVPPWRRSGATRSRDFLHPNARG